MDKAGRSGAGWRSVGGRSAVGERRSEVGRIGGRSGDHSITQLLTRGSPW